ncbi:arginase [Natrinema thermotolerans DSM 11552]|uniref:arginase n=1 Tax=Natrinema sp. CGMCC1.2065 TaxID=3445767 RepID=UPI0002B172AC|nr:arginase [Natrinema thermotolerans DSM 11552]
MTTPTDARIDHPNRSTTRTVRLLGAPLDLGADRRGVDIGPRAIRYADIAGELETAGVACTDCGDLRVPRLEQCDVPDTEDDAKYLDEIADVTAELADEVADTIADGDVPIALGGDHATAMGTIRGAARAADIGVLWFDAHGDYNTPDTSPSGNVHGMPLAAVTGTGEFDGLDWTTTPTVDPSNTVIVGARRLDNAERTALKESDVTVFTMHDIDERGITAVVEDALDIATDGVDGVHVSLDLDWLDPTVAPGVGTPVRGGVEYREAHAALECVAERDRDAELLRSVDIVEVNPILDRNNRTAEVAAELAASLLGKRIA